MHYQTEVLSIEDVRRRFDEAGVSVSQWACDKGLSPAVVYALLAGRVRGRRGEAHRAAVALGLKKGSDLRLPMSEAGTNTITASPDTAVEFYNSKIQRSAP